LSVEPSVAVGPAPYSKLAPDEAQELPDYDKDDSDDEVQHYGNDDHSTVYETGVSCSLFCKSSLLLTKTDSKQSLV
jgi:hypothetical protein